MARARRRNSRPLFLLALSGLLAFVAAVVWFPDAPWFVHAVPTGIAFVAGWGAVLFEVLS